MSDFILSGHDQLPRGENTNQIEFIWTDELVKQFAEGYRFSSSRLSIEQFKKDPNWFNQKSVNENYELAIAESEKQLLQEATMEEIERLKGLLYGFVRSAAYRHRMTENGTEYSIDEDLASELWQQFQKENKL